jgi:peptidoglycan/LPS O-acetylase OafA/YrhL
LKQSGISYFKNLDVLRLICFIIIFCRHGFFSNSEYIETTYLEAWRKQYFSFSSVGLDFFSVLSSFLITWLILNEYNTFEQFNLKNFYVRRILRIWPLYFLIVAIAYVAIPLISSLLNTESPSLPSIGWFLSFTSNYYAGYINENFVFFLLFLWFIAVEEQFYLVWGFLLKYFNNYFEYLCTFLLVIYFVIAYFFSTPTFPSFYDTINYIPNFVIGAYLAKISVSKNTLYSNLEKLTSTFWIALYLFTLIILIFYNTIFSNQLEHLKHIVLSILFAFIIFENSFRTKSMFAFGQNKILSYLGKISFGLYCWHGLVITLIKKGMEKIGHVDTEIDVFVLYPIITLLLTVGISILSFELFEKRFLKLKQYFSAFN